MMLTVAFWKEYCWARLNHRFAWNRAIFWSFEIGHLSNLQGYLGHGATTYIVSFNILLAGIFMA